MLPDSNNTGRSDPGAGHRTCGFLDRVPLTLKMVVPTVIVGICLWALLDYIQSNKLKNIFYVQLFDELSEQAMGLRIRLDRNIRFHNETAELIVSQKTFSDYVERQKWTDAYPAQTIYPEYPPWMLKPSIMRTLISPRHALLLDPKGRVREVYSRYADAPLPEELLHPSRIMLIKSCDQSYVTDIGSLHYVIASESLTDAGGKTLATVMLATPIDEEFLVSALGTMQPRYLIALVTPDEDPKILISSSGADLPPGSSLSSLLDRFLVTGQFTYSYGEAEYMINLVSFISAAEADKLTEAVITTGRNQRNIIAPAFILMFMAMLFLISRRVRRLNVRMSDFSRQTLGGQPESPASGDKLYILEKRFERLTEEVIEAREILRKQAEEETLKESHERLLTVLDGLEAIVYVADMNTYDLLFANKYTRKAFGDIESRICWQTLQSGQTGPCSFCSNDKLLTPSGGPAEVYHWEFQNTVNGRWYLIQDRAIQWIDGRLVRMEIATDITERKDAETRIKESLRDKETLLKEIHHRVKNNMQIISSLLNIQSGKIKNRPEAEVFNESRNRITAMALVHEKLYRSEDLARIDFTDYVRSLSNSLFAFYGKNTRNISCQISAQGTMLGVDTAIPCGLIINELLSNSLKYAFPDDRRGEICIGLKKLGPGSEWDYELLVRDNGTGIPEEMDINKTGSLGLQLVINLAEHQLQGNVQLKRSGGAEFLINIKEPKYKRRL